MTIAVATDANMRCLSLQVLFHNASRKLITASQDGLVAVHDISSGLDQDDGFIAALNVGTSVEQLGLYGSEQQHMWCRTGTETLQLWDWLAATVEGMEGGDVAVADLTEARQMAAAAAGSSSAASLFTEVGNDIFLLSVLWLLQLAILRLQLLAFIFTVCCQDSKHFVIIVGLLCWELLPIPSKASVLKTFDPSLCCYVCCRLTTS